MAGYAVTATDLLDRARLHGATFTVNGGHVEVSAPAPLPSALMEALRQHKLEVLAYLAPSPCACSPMHGAAIVGRYPACPECSRSWRCPTCDGCRACASGVGPDFGTTGQAQLLERLQLGQRWLVERYEAIADAQQVTDAARDLFLAGLDRWCILEKTLRDWYGFAGCVLASGGCDPDSPVICDSCARARVLPSQ